MFIAPKATHARVGRPAAVVTFSVGGLSATNAIGGAYAENLPVILVSGAPNSNDRATENLIHHTLATHDWSYQLEIAKKLTCAAVSITSATDAPHQIDHAIRSALREKKPAYIEASTADTWDNQGTPSVMTMSAALAE